MSGLFSKPKKPAAPPPPPAPPPVPQEGVEPAEFEMRRTLGRSGFRKTILTGALSPDTGKKKLLGG